MQPTEALAAAVGGLDRPPPVWVQASTLAIYGDAGDAVLDETAAGAPAVRQVVLRTGIVLDRDTPALDRLTGLVRWGLGGRVGTGASG